MSIFSILILNWNKEEKELVSEIMPRNLLVSLVFLRISKLNRFNSLVCHLTCFLTKDSNYKDHSKDKILLPLPY